MKAPGDLAARVGVAVVGIPVVFGALWAGGWWLGGILAVAAAIGAREFHAMLEATGARPFRLLGAGFAASTVLVATVHPSLHDAGEPMIALLVGATLVTAGMAVFRRWPDGRPASAIAGTLAGVLYVGVPLAFVPVLRATPEALLLDVGLPGSGSVGAMTAMSLVLLPLLTTWAGDSAAYFTGHAVGRRKLAPKVSPGKTIEGSLGGLVGATGAAVLVTMWWINPHPVIELPLPVAAGIGAAIGVATQLGDLVESLLKREAGIKDSGAIFPGHGGMLDRLDALLFAFPVAWLLLSLAGVRG